MSYNGSGVFQINSFGQPVVAGTLIEAAVFNLFSADMAAGLSNAICRDGQSSTTSRIPFAFGINSSSVEESVSLATGSAIVQGGAAISKTLFVGLGINAAAGKFTVDGVTGAVASTGVYTANDGIVIAGGTGFAVGKLWYEGAILNAGSGAGGVAITSSSGAFTNLGLSDAGNLTVRGTFSAGEGIAIPTGKTLSGAGAINITGSATLGASTDKVIASRLSDATTYGMVTFNGVLTAAGHQGVFGKSGVGLGLNTPVGTAIEFDVGLAIKGTVDTNGFNGVLGGTTPAAATVTSLLTTTGITASSSTISSTPGLGAFIFSNFSIREQSGPVWNIDGWNGSSFGSRLSITGAGAVTIPGTLSVTGALTGSSFLKASDGVATPAGGTSATGIIFGSAAVQIVWGSGAPTLSAARGSLYLRTDNGASTSLYINRDGNITWAAVTSL